MPPAFIYFDLGNVLLTFDRSQAFRQMAAVAGVSVEQVEATLFADGLQHRYESGLVSSEQFYDEFCRVTGSRPEYDALHRAGSDMFQLNCSVVPIVVHLRAAGYRLGILSNTCPAHWELVIARYRILQIYFEPCVLSYQVGVMKPEAAIYEAAARRAGVAGERIFYCDDHLENVEGARRCGWDAELFTGYLTLADQLRQRGVEFNY